MKIRKIFRPRSFAFDGLVLTILGTVTVFTKTFRIFAEGRLIMYKILRCIADKLFKQSRNS